MCTQLIQVNDQIPPTIACPSGLAVSCETQIPPVELIDFMTSDNCGGSVTVTHLSDLINGQTCATNFTVTRTYIAEDDCGNTATCTQVIALSDQIAPIITCPASITVSCTNTVPTGNPNSVTATDNCGGTVIKSYVGDAISNKTCDNRYLLTRTYKVTDFCGNTASCTQKITVYDNTPPVITCPVSITVACAKDVPAANPASVTANDNCGLATAIHMGDLITSKTCDNRFTLSRTYKAIDGCGQFAYCTQKITVYDNIPPVISCPANLTVSCANEVPLPNLGALTVNDNCTGFCSKVCVGDVISNKTCFNRYVINRTYKVVDACSNSATCVQTITVNDQTIPTVACPTNITVDCASLVPAMNLTLVNATDNCSGTVTKGFVGDYISEQICANNYLLTRVYKATDVCGNTGTCSQLIRVYDKKQPTITCPVNTTVSCASTVPAVNLAAVTASDNCGGAAAKSHIGDQISNQTCDNRYLITRTYQAMDACGNFKTCSQLITVNDQTVPTITCPANTSVSCASQVPVVNLAALTASDNCGTITKEHAGDQIANKTCDNRYTLYRTYKVTDACGKTATCKQTITVNDQTAPTIVCPANSTVTCANQVPAVNLPDISVNDNCSGSVTKAHVGDLISNKSCENKYLLTRTYKVTDACGKTATCSQKIKVEDQAIPTISCPANTTVSCVSQVPPVNLPGVPVSDNCGGTIITTHVGDAIVDYVCSNQYTIKRLFRATDACNNTTTCIQVIQVKDQAPPAGQCPEAIIVSCADDMPCSDSDPEVAAIIKEIKADFSDNCGSPVTVALKAASPLQECTEDDYTFSRTLTFSIKDACGNATECAVQVSGSCFCTYTQGFWGNGKGKANGLTGEQILDTLMKQGSIVVGDGSNCGFTVTTRQCVIGILPGGGPSLPLSKNYALDCTKEIKNTLVGQLIALQLNIRYNEHFRDLNLDGFTLSGSCVLSTDKVKALGLNANSTMSDLIDLSNEYLAATCNDTTYANGFGGQLTEALTAMNEYWDECKNNDPCDETPFGPDDNLVQGRGEGKVFTNQLGTLSLAPNPAFSVLNVGFMAETPARVEIRVFDGKGRLIYTKPVDASTGENVIPIDVTGLDSGVYWLSLANDLTNLSKRFVVFRD